MLLNAVPYFTVHARQFVLPLFVVLVCLQNADSAIVQQTNLISEFSFVCLSSFFLSFCLFTK